MYVNFAPGGLVLCSNFWKNSQRISCFDSGEWYLLRRPCAELSSKIRLVRNPSWNLRVPLASSIVEVRRDLSKAVDSGGRIRRLNR